MAKHDFENSFFYRHILSALMHPQVRRLCRKYPFLKVRNVCTGKFMGYSCSMLDWLPEGWRKAFGDQLAEDIARALKADKIKKSKWAKSVYWYDIKEKYGTLRLYASTTDKVQEVLDKYEAMSYGYCIECGKPARYITEGWISYQCETCAKEHDHKRRLTKKDLPVYVLYDNNEEKEISIKDRYNIDLEKLWGLKNGKKQ